MEFTENEAMLLMKMYSMKTTENTTSGFCKYLDGRNWSPCTYKLMRALIKMHVLVATGERINDNERTEKLFSFRRERLTAILKDSMYYKLYFNILFHEDKVGDRIIEEFKNKQILIVDKWL